MNLSKFAGFFALSGALAGCGGVHTAPIRQTLLPPPSASPVQHSSRLVVDLGEATWETQCRAPEGYRQVCFEGVRRAALGALSRALWNSFPDVVLAEEERPRPGDYLLRFDIVIEPLPPDATGPGWSAVALGGFQLSRDGQLLVEEKLSSRSRGVFAYGSALGVGAGEVVDAFATHVASVLGALPEPRPLRPAPLPAVVAEPRLPAPAVSPPTPPVAAR